MYPEAGYAGFWVGTYTSPAPQAPKASGKGIYRGRLTDDLEWNNAAEDYLSR